MAYPITLIHSFVLEIDEIDDSGLGLEENYIIVEYIKFINEIFNVSIIYYRRNQK